MRAYSEILEQILTIKGIDLTKPIAPVFKYYGYSNGAVTEYPSLTEAKKHCALYETVKVNKKEINDRTKAIDRAHAEAETIFDSEFIQEVNKIYKRNDLFTNDQLSIIDRFIYETMGRDTRDKSRINERRTEIIDLYLNLKESYKD